MQTLNACRKYILVGAAALAAINPIGTAQAGVTVLHAFAGGNDGAHPLAALIDKAGVLYGTTEQGGGTGCNGAGCGTVFELAPDGTETVLHAFTGGNDGNFPYAGLTEDKAGNFYGTTQQGGSTGCDGLGCGTVFELAPDGTETVLHAFIGGNDGFYPTAGLIEDKAGNFYGTTIYGGGYNIGECYGSGCGTVFKLASDGTETVLHVFTGGNDGFLPTAGLTEGKADSFYGTTELGGGAGGNGCAEFGCGTVFKIAPDGTETILYAFTAGNDGAFPEAGLIQDKAGNLYGTTTEGGSTTCGPYPCGTVFKLAPDGTETVLYAFVQKRHEFGAYPEAGLIEGSGDNLYGTTFAGGSAGSCYRPHRGCGTVFRLKK